MHTGSDEPRLLLPNQHHHKGADGVQELCVGVYSEIARIDAAVDILADAAHHPEYPEDVVEMPVGDINGMDFVRRDASPPELRQYSIAAAPVHEQVTSVFAEQETGVVAAGDHGAASAKHEKFHSKNPFLRGTYFVVRVQGNSARKVPMRMYRRSGGCRGIQTRTSFTPPGGSLCMPPDAAATLCCSLPGTFPRFIFLRIKNKGRRHRESLLYPLPFRRGNFCGPATGWRTEDGFGRD